MSIAPIQFGTATTLNRGTGQRQNVPGIESTIITPNTEDSDIQLSLSSSESNYTSRPFLSVTSR